ncbi:hypothetical protein NC653_040523 [Populus alba x Populus x berolinensis]|uniref:Uncharacterized protein n=1 Tax=Populus alba x Populus x berolinensis TaxID=444605 RepID=A0AAD6L6R2_9ROSI|nr:hypothetical protein NC653_040523 [Populus alba x Populus x berolinensis]
MTRNRVDAESTAAEIEVSSCFLNKFVFRALRKLLNGECEEDVPVALISFHGCSLDGKVKMTSDAQVVE